MSIPRIERSGAVSLRDVAARAGVSGQTVSRVANDHPNVSPATRSRVLAAMAELGYRPNGAARALRRGAFASIGVVVFDLQTLGNLRTLGAVADRAAALGYAIELIQVDAEPAVRADGVSSALTRLGRHAVDGIVVVIESQLVSAVTLEFPAGIPSVVVESGDRPDIPSVNTDQTQGSELAVGHLLSLGHPTVQHIAGPAASNSAHERTAAWRAALERAGRSVPSPLTGDWSADSGYRAGLVLADDPEVTAVYAANDQMALGAMHAFHERGVRIPQEVSIVGFDDMAESSQFWPPLTTVHQDFEAAGATAVDLIVREIETGHSDPGLHTIDTRLIVRESTGPYGGARVGRIIQREEHE
ncbi:MAG: LacI family DNA-binding transcriptional regulator [Microbacterium sp.]|uniref:LacI family DNA-binding transcriptional regulator n=1 Tax=Microbacterium sp. TaxID=51671 RepID=UPI0039E44AF8